MLQQDSRHSRDTLYNSKSLSTLAQGLTNGSATERSKRAAENQTAQSLLRPFRGSGEKPLG